MSTQIHSIYLVSGGAQSLSHFYRDALDLHVRFADGDRWVQMSDGKASLAIAAPSEAPIGHELPTLVFRSTELEAVRDKILSMGGKEIEWRDMGTHGRLVTFSDPENNVFQVLEPFVPAQQKTDGQ